jgi:hypothetical protein
MADKFLNTGGAGGGDLTNGTININAATLAADNLEPSKALKTNSTKQLISTNLEIADINNLQNELDNTISNPLTADLNAGTNFINNLADPVNPQDGSTKNYVDTEISNIPSANIAREIYVNPTTGNDGTGLRGDSTKPFLTIASAYAASNAGDHIICAAGDVGNCTITNNVTITGVISNGNPQTFMTGLVIFDISTSTGVNVSGIGFTGFLTNFANSAATGGNRFTNCTFLSDVSFSLGGTFTGGNYFQNCYINREWTINNAFVIFSENSGGSAQKYRVDSGTFLIENHVSSLGGINHFGGTVDINDVQSFNNNLGGNIAIFSQVDTGTPLTQFLIIRNCYLIDGITNLKLEILGSINIGLAIYNTNILDANLILTGTYTDVAINSVNNGLVSTKNINNIDTVESINYSQNGETGELVITGRAGTTDNIIIGDSAPSLQVGGTNNVYIGNGTATGQLTGDRNCFVGNVIMNNHTGSDCVSVGFNNQCFGNQNGIIMYGAGCSTNTSSVMCIGQNVSNLVPNSVKIGLFNTVNIRSNTVDVTDLGMNTERFKDLYMIGGIKNNQGSIIDMSQNNIIDLQATNVQVNGVDIASTGDLTSKLNIDGTNAMTSDLDLGEQNIINLGSTSAPWKAHIKPAEGIAANVAIGQLALDSIINCSANYALGYRALQAVQFGQFNTGIGAQAGYQIIDGGENICIGSLAGRLITNGDNNVCIGVSSDVQGGTNNNSIAIGTSATATLSQECVFGAPSAVQALTHIRAGRDATTDLGTGTFQYKDIYLSGAVNANSLNIAGDTLSNYLRLDGTNAMTADLNLNNNDLDNVKNIVANNPATPILIDSAGGVETNGKITLTGLDKSLNGIKTINRADPLEPINIISESNVEIYGGLYIGGVTNRRPVCSGGYAATGTVAFTDAFEVDMIPAGVGSLVTPANNIKPASTSRADFCGDVSTVGNNQFLRIRLKINAVTVSTFDVEIESVTNQPWSMYSVLQCKTEGVAGTMVMNSVFTYERGTLGSRGSGRRTLFNIDTTIDNTFSVTGQWLTPDPANTIGIDIYTSTNVYQPS